MEDREFEVDKNMEKLGRGSALVIFGLVAFGLGGYVAGENIKKTGICSSPQATQSVKRPLLQP